MDKRLGVPNISLYQITILNTTVIWIYALPASLSPLGLPFLGIRPVVVFVGEGFSALVGEDEDEDEEEEDEDEETEGARACCSFSPSPSKSPVSSSGLVRSSLERRL